MKRIVTFLLVLVSLVGIIGYSPVSAKTKVKETLLDMYDYEGKGKYACADFYYKTDDNYVITIKNESSYKTIKYSKTPCSSDSYYVSSHDYNIYYNTYGNDYIKYIPYYKKDTWIGKCVTFDKSLTVQLQLVSTKTGKAVKNKKVKYYAYNAYDEPNPEYLTRNGKFTLCDVPNIFEYDEDYYHRLTGLNNMVCLYAVYKNRIYSIDFKYDYNKSFFTEQEKIDSDPFKYAPEADQADHWYLVPKGYKWADNRCGTVIETKHKDGTVDKEVYIFPAVFIYEGQKIEWVIKNYDTGEEISVNKAQKQTDVCYKTFESTLKVKKDGKTIKYNKLGTDKNKKDSGLYAASILRVYYNGMIYGTYVVVLPTKADAEWCENNADSLSDPFFGTEVYLYDYCKYKGLSTDAWDW